RGDQRLSSQVRPALMEPLRRRLFLLAAAGIVPLAAAAGVALLALAAEQKAQAERAGIEVTRALATAVDAELYRSVAALESLAQGPALDTGDLKRFHEVMRRLHAGRPDWVTVTLADPAGQPACRRRITSWKRFRSP